ncbi:ubiquitin-like protein transferase [Fragilaria crotonensis]|nr:ubiquitin-like protein transferase [Fragilaria crotonensis]
MGKKANLHQSAAAPELLNFHFATAPAQQREAQPRRTTGGRNRTHDLQQYRRSEQDRLSARRKASSQMFPLHSSAYHGFSLTRKSKQEYSFKGHDTPVSWESVRIVKYLCPATDAHNVTDSQETCPICLDNFTCPRITKCGHCFCLLPHAAQSYKHRRKRSARRELPLL